MVSRTPEQIAYEKRSKRLTLKCKHVPKPKPNHHIVITPSKQKQGVIFPHWD